MKKTKLALSPAAKKRMLRKDMVAYAFIAPNFIGFAIFTLVPMVVAFYMSLCEWDGSNPAKFVGLSNYINLTDDTFFLNSLFNTFLYSVGTVPLTMIVSLGLAILLNQKIKGRGVIRTIACLPYVSSIIAVTTVWRMIFHPAKGPVNAMLYYAFHVDQNDLPQWFTGRLIILSYILFSLWKSMGYYMVIYLAGLQGINNELYEAGSLDGASGWQKFKYITWPQLRPTTFFVIIIMTISCFKIYDTAVLLAGSSNLSTSAMVLVSFIYNQAFGNWKLG
ncbi:MAG: sugar ABC transporter permease, partial [Lachnospiraceae bacterium]|nr:sugar ABC transporter permease [Lachnospiraceae bacterium]